MISDACTPEVDGETASLVDAQLRWCVVVDACGATEMRYFRSPHDVEGITIRLTPREREELGHALAKGGVSFLLRDDRGKEFENAEDAETQRRGKDVRRC